ncbi:MAG: hypothetical protein IPM79_18810 [Polyangiaceae bacterium]|nr:hypothetical protein [Polyangiaceae bacterium]
MINVRRSISLLGFVAVAITLVGTPLGCLPEIPALEAPQMPAAEIPQAPEVQVPEFQPPDVQVPEGPELPAEPPPSVGNCCIRTGKLLKEKCKGAMSCCTDSFEGAGECKENKGHWFFTPEGCAGAC